MGCSAKTGVSQQNLPPGKKMDIDPVSTPVSTSSPTSVPDISNTMPQTPQTELKGSPPSGSEKIVKFEPSEPSASSQTTHMPPPSTSPIHPKPPTAAASPSSHPLPFSPPSLQAPTSMKLEPPSSSPPPAQHSSSIKDKKPPQDPSMTDKKPPRPPKVSCTDGDEVDTLLSFIEKLTESCDRRSEAFHHNTSIEAPISESSQSSQGSKESTSQCEQQHRKSEVHDRVICPPATVTNNTYTPPPSPPPPSSFQLQLLPSHPSGDHPA